MLRFFIGCIAVFIFLVPLGLPLCGIAMLLGLFSPRAMHAFSQPLLRVFFRALLLIAGTRITCEGLEHLPGPGEAVCYISNHRSVFDTVIGYVLAPGLTSFIGKKELERVPLFSRWMRNTEGLFIDRSSPRQGLQVILAAAELIRGGRSVWVCPEGTRSHEEKMLPFREGSFKIAAKTGCPLVPVVLTGTDDIWENHFPALRPAAVTVTVLPGIETAGLSREALRALPGRLQAEMQQVYDRQKAKQP